jgi:prolyl oligopeptidase
MAFTWPLSKQNPLALCAGGVLLFAAGCAAQRPDLPPPPATQVVEVREVLHGQVVADPYRWLEKTEDPQVQAWMKSQADYSRTVLSRITGRQELLDRMLQVENSAAARVSRVALTASGHLFFLRRGAGDAHARLAMRDSVDGSDRVVVDPSVFGPKHAINYFFASPNGRFVAYGVSDVGSENATFYLRDLETGRDIVGPIEEAKFNGFSAYRWESDSSGVYFQTTRERGSFTEPKEAFQWPRLWRVAARPNARPEIVADGRRKLGPELGPSDFMAGLAFAGSPHQFLYIEGGVKRDIRLLARPKGTLGSGGWRPLIDHQDGIWLFDVHGDRVYGLTHKGAPRFRVVATSIEKPNWANPTVVVPEGRGVIQWIAAAQDALYATVLDGGTNRLLRVPHGSSRVEEIELPFPGSVRFTGHHVERPGVIISLDGWTSSTQFYEVRADSRQPRLTSLQPRGEFDRLDGIEARVIDAISHDGVKVPLSIVARPTKGPRPTIIVAYGAYGFPQEPRLRAEWVPWLERGYVMATCHVRGGGEYGQQWYEGGKKRTKPNSWKDLIACAEQLIAEKITTPARLGIMGWSAGGIPVGRALTERPDLFAAAAPGVGVLDAVRAEVEPNGPANIAEFGTHTNADEFAALLQMSAYHHVKKGVRYPAVILPHGVNDPRVVVWQSSKMAAALQASGSSAPVLLNLDYDAGHGVGSSTVQRLSTFADSIAFMLWQFGEPGYQLE